MQGLRDDKRDALSKFGEINELLWSLLEAAEVSAADRTATSHTASEDISDSDQYITKAEDTLFEISRYLENHPALVSPVAPIAASASASARGHKISFRAMTHDDCGCGLCSWRTFSPHMESRRKLTSVSP